VAGKKNEEATNKQAWQRGGKETKPLGKQDKEGPILEGLTSLKVAVIKKKIKKKKLVIFWGGGLNTVFCSRVVQAKQGEAPRRKINAGKRKCL